MLTPRVLATPLLCPIVLALLFASPLLGRVADLTGPPCQAIGTPRDGSLEGGVPLPDLPALYIRKKKIAIYGTWSTVAALVAGTLYVALTHPGSHRPLIGALSNPGGGPFPPHASHQNGLDADMGFYYQNVAEPPVGYVTATPETLDAPRTMALVTVWYHWGILDSVFLDHTLQEPLYDYAAAHLDALGLDEASLDELFQYPAPPTEATGLIRHAPSHANHLHVRFVCPWTSPACSTGLPAPAS